MMFSLLDIQREGINIVFCKEPGSYLTHVDDVGRAYVQHNCKRFRNEFL